MGLFLLRAIVLFRMALIPIEPRCRRLLDPPFMRRGPVSETFLVACRDVINVRLGFYLPISPFRVRGKGKKLDRASYDLYIVRIAYTLEGKEYYAMSRPCKSCLALLKSYGVRRVYYTVLSRPGELRYQMEKIKDMETDHISGGMRSTFSNSKNVFAKY